MEEMNGRREFLKMGGALLAAGTAGCATGMTGSAEAGSGLTIAKYAKKEYPNFDVVLVEKRGMYSSCFSSNLWYSGLLDLEFPAGHGFLDAAVNHKYLYWEGFHAAFNELYKGIIEYKPGMAVNGVDVEKKTIKTEFDAISFDDAAIYANVRGATLIGQLGLMAPTR